MKKCLLLLLLGISVHLNAQNIQGVWSGVLEVSGAKLRLVVNLTSDGKCTLDSPDQGAKDIPAVLEYVSADSLSVAVPALGMNYAGRLKAGKIEGVFKQSTFVAPLVLSPGKTTLNRPQTPLPPFAYATEEVYFLKNILVLRNAFEKTRKQMKVNALSINALSDNLNFPMFAKLTLKKT